MTDITDFSLIGNRLIGDVLADEELRLEDIKICNGRDGHIIRSGPTTSDSTWWSRALPDAGLDDDESEDPASFGYTEIEGDGITDKGLHETREERHDEEDADEEWRSRINNWIDAGHQSWPQIPTVMVPIRLRDLLWERRLQQTTANL
ncbi:hypothetical protein ACO22_06073 [Paracoccidioides brasiliensis]|uniref:Uncharacterized protein n=1 Tax=Paracoccidioides brasiliensis TaxID=121759 RepID=A0A1D2J8H7_PARBR|nr:hypothetical protein ACO22_06073 [Paracoccidioides brasiliensis]